MRIFKISQRRLRLPFGGSLTLMRTITSLGTSYEASLRWKRPGGAA